MTDHPARPRFAVAPAMLSVAPRCQPHRREISPRRSTEMPPLVHATAITRAFESSTAVDGLDLTIDRGEVFGLLGLS
jgi:hypothetical protein